MANPARRSGSFTANQEAAILQEGIKDGVIATCRKHVIMGLNFQIHNLTQLVILNPKTASKMENR